MAGMNLITINDPKALFEHQTSIIAPKFRAVLSNARCRFFTSQAMNWTSTSVTTLTSTTTPTILVDFGGGKGNSKFLFNLGEGSSRAAGAGVGGWKRVGAVFVSQVTSRCLGGLVGVLMGVADGGSTGEVVRLLGPPGLDHWMAAMRGFTYRKTLALHTTEIPISTADSKANDPIPILKDDNGTIYGFPVFPSSLSESSPSVKRKRSPSPSNKYSSLANALADPSFTPSSLSSDLASEYRQHIIQTMFPGISSTTSDSPDTGATGRAVKGAKGVSSKDARSTRKGGTNDGTVRSSKTGEAPPLVDMRVPLQPRRFTSSANTVGNGDEDDEYHRRLPRAFHHPLPKPPCAPQSSPVSMAYIAVGPRYRGKFDAQKAVQLGVPNGSIRSQLARGEDVTLPDGRLIKSSDVVGESWVPSAVVILDVPTTEYVAGLVDTFKTSPFYSRFWEKGQREKWKDEQVVRVVYHILGQDAILESDEYGEFMNGFGVDVWHIFSAPSYLPDKIPYHTAAYNTLHLHNVDPYTFPLPTFSLRPRKDYTSLAHLPAKTVPMEADVSVSMRPPKPPEKDTAGRKEDLFHTLFEEGGAGVDGVEVSEKMREARKTIEEARPRADKTSIGVELTTLGTGSAVPGIHRSVTSNILRAPHGSLLLDCGEGTWGQLIRFFGKEEAESILRKDLKCVFVSHSHADHHLGLVGLLHARKMLDPPPRAPLYLIANRRIHQYLKELSFLQDLGYPTTSITPASASSSPSSISPPQYSGVIPILADCLHYKSPPYTSLTRGPSGIPPAEFWWSNSGHTRHFARELEQTLGLSENGIKTVDVRHRASGGSFGLVIRSSTEKDGTHSWGVVWSGDTLPCDSLVNAGSELLSSVPKAKRLLLHEGTFSSSPDNDELEMAKAKYHSTVSQAIEVGNKMGAGMLVLTHFSGRYPGMIPLPSVPPSSDGQQMGVGIAFDGARFAVGSEGGGGIWSVAGWEELLGEVLEGVKREGDEVERMEIGE